MRYKNIHFEYKRGPCRTNNLRTSRIKIVIWEHKKKLMLVEKSGSHWKFMVVPLFSNIYIIEKKLTKKNMMEICGDQWPRKQSQLVGYYVPFVECTAERITRIQLNIFMRNDTIWIECWYVFFLLPFLFRIFLLPLLFFSPCICDSITIFH